MATIKYDGVEKTYPDGTKAIPGISLEVRDREFMVFVGPSGCGKTTVLRMTAGLEDITGGRLYIGDRVVNSLPPQKRDIAMVFQDYALYPHMTVRDNIGFALRMMGRPKSEIRQRVDAAAARLSLTALLDRKPRNLSGGQRQRVAMGRAIVREPQAFLMDEPLSNLDAKLRVQMRAEISSLQRQLGVTTVYVTHDQVEAMTMGDRVAVMKSGLLQQVAPPEELYERPVNIFVAGFIGSPKMNLFESVLRRRSGGGAYVTFGQQELAIPDDVLRERPALRERNEGPIKVGIRPDGFFLSPNGPSDQSLQVTTEVVESLGNERMVHFIAPVRKASDADARDQRTELEEITPDGGTSMFIARIPPYPKVREREAVRFGVNTKGLYFFDEEGNSLL
jgi:multiple sugar transport system ATP-binding protein